MKKIVINFIILGCLLSAKKVEAQNNEINSGIRVQFRDTLSIPERGEIENQVQLRRARINLNGHLVNRHNNFKIQLGLSPKDLGVKDDFVTKTPLLDYYFDFTHFRNFSLMVGQYKVPFSRERIMSSGDLAFVDRSLSAGTLDITRDIGVTLHSQDFFNFNAIRYYIGVYSGLGRDGYLSQQVTKTSPLFITRFEFHPFGLFDNNSQVNFNRTNDVKTSLGVGYGITGNVHRLTLDEVFHYQGFSFETAGIARMNEKTHETDLGYYLQAHSLIPETEHYGVALRYGQVIPLEKTAINERNEFGGSLSYYFEEHKIKLQLDIFEYWATNIKQDEQQIRLHLQVGS